MLRKELIGGRTRYISNGIHCDVCGLPTKKMLMVLDTIWKKISWRKDDFICPTCMEHHHGRTFRKDELKGDPPYSSWYIDNKGTRNG